jgi:gluconolactonase
VDAQGDVYVADPAGARILRIEPASGRMQPFRERAEDVRGMAFGADGRLYAGQPSRKRIVAWTADGKESVVAGGLEVDHLVVGANGGIWATDTSHRRVWHVDPRGGKRVAQEGTMAPTALAISGDQALLAVGDEAGRWAWSFPLAADGSLRHGEAFYRLETGEAPSAGTVGMTVDSEGYLYVATPRGVQVFDQPGRVTAIIDLPALSPASSITFGGRDLDRLYLASGDQVFRRRLRRQGVFPGQAIKLPTPRL